MPTANPNNAFFIAAQAGVVPKAEGIPGCAKTAIINAFAKKLGRRCYVVIGSIRDPADIGGYPFPEQNGSKFIQLVPPQYVHDIVEGAKHGEKWVLFWDEITTVPPAVQAAMLRPIAEWVIGDTPLPEDTIQVAASNPPGIAANGFELEPPMANRMCHLRWEMDWEAWKTGLSGSLSFPEPEFPILPADWKKRIGDVASMVVAFHRYRPTLFTPPVDAEGNVQLERAKLGGPWPSPRSWTNAVKCLAAATACGADDGIKHQLISGCVSEPVGTEFFTWQRNLDLPDPEDLLEEFIQARKKNREPNYKHPDRPDKTIAMLGSVTHAILNDITRERWEAGIDVLFEASKQEMDVAFSCAGSLVGLLRPERRPSSLSGLKIDPKIVRHLFPSIYKTGQDNVIDK